MVQHRLRLGLPSCELRDGQGGGQPGTQSYPQGQRPGSVDAQHSRVKWRRAGRGHDTRRLAFRLRGLVQRIACSLTHHVSDPWDSQGLTLTPAQFQADVASLGAPVTSSSWPFSTLHGASLESHKT